MLSRPNHGRPSRSLCRVRGLVQASPYSASLYTGSGQVQTALSRGLNEQQCNKSGGAKDMLPGGQTRRGDTGGRALVSQRTDLGSDVLKGGRTDQGEAYQEHILGENQRDG